MKKSIKIGLASVVAIASTFARASDIAYQAGIKIWHHDLSTSYSDSTGGVEGNYAAANSSVLSLSAKKDQLFIAASTLLKSDYNLEPEAKTGNIGVPYVGVSSRKDFDIGVGWSFFPQLSVIVGYKQVGGTRNYWFKKLMELENNAVLGRPYGDYNVHNDLTIKAPFVGISGAQKVSESCFIYANAIKGVGAKLDLTLEEGYKQIDGTPKAPGVKASQYTSKNQIINPSANYLNVELGIGYVLSANAQIALGYRSQKMTLDDRPEAQIKEDGTMKGFNFGVSYRF